MTTVMLLSSLLALAGQALRAWPHLIDLCTAGLLGVAALAPLLPRRAVQRPD